MRKRASAAKKFRLVIGDATSSDISTVLIPEKSPEENSVISLTGRRFEFNVLKVIMLEMGRQGPVMSLFLNVSQYPRKIKTIEEKQKTVEGSGESCRQFLFRKF